MNYCVLYFRHHYETFTGHNDSMIVMLDNAKSFGNPTHDELSIIIPLLQCCKYGSHCCSLNRVYFHNCLLSQFWHWYALLELPGRASDIATKWPHIFHINQQYLQTCKDIFPNIIKYYFLKYMYERNFQSWKYFSHLKTQTSLTLG